MKAHVWQVCMALMAILAGIGAMKSHGQTSSVQMPRTDAIEAMRGRLVIADYVGASLTDDNRVELSAALQKYFDEVAKDILPDTLVGDARDGITKAMPDRIVVMSSDVETEKVRIKKTLMGVVLKLKFESRYADTVSTATLDQVRTNVDYFTEQMATKMQLHLLGSHPMFTQEEIDAQVKGIKQQLLAGVGDPTSYWMTRPLNDEAIDHVLKEFDRRLAECKDRIVRMLEDGAEKGRDGMARPTESLTEAGRDELLREITSRCAGAFLRRSVNPDLASIDPDQLVPGYTSVVKELARLEREATNREREEWSAKHPPYIPDNVRLARRGVQALEQNIDKTISSVGLHDMKAEHRDAISEPPNPNVEPGTSREIERPSEPGRAEAWTKFHVIGLVALAGSCVVLAGW